MAKATVRYCLVCNSDMTCLSAKRRFCSDKCRFQHTRKLRKQVEQPELKETNHEQPL